MVSLISESIGKDSADEKIHEERGVEPIYLNEVDYKKARILVVGIGGAGNNTINLLTKANIAGVETIAVNTDKKQLDLAQAQKKLLIGKTITRGLGAGGYPEVGKRAAELTHAEIEEVLQGGDLVFITAGLGGGTGTGASPIIASIAKKMGAIIIAMVSMPFKVERARIAKAEEGLEQLKATADAVIVLDNNRLLEYVPNLPINMAFAAMDELVSQTIRGISETISLPSLINLDFADIRSIMSGGGISVMLYGESNEQNKAEAVVHEALDHPLLDIDYRGATGALIHITGGQDMTLAEAEHVARALTKDINPKANVIWGARVLPEFENKMRVIAILTGIQSADKGTAKNEPLAIADFEEVNEEDENEEQEK